MQSFLTTLLVCSVTMSALALLYMAITPLLAKRYTVTSRYYAWLILVAGLIIPFRPQFGHALVQVETPRMTHMTITRANAGAAPTPHATSLALADLSWWQLAAALWLAGMILFIAYHLIKHYQFLKLTARWSEMISSGHTLTLFHRIKGQMGITRRIDLQACDSIGTPMLLGFTRPRILLPRADFTDEELCFILKHELVHYQRKDLWYKCLVLLATAIHWFNPIVHLMAKFISLQGELSCDAEVVRSTDAEARLSYSETIIGVIRHHQKRQTALSTTFYGGKNGMKKRISSIMDMNRKKAGIAILCCALLLTLGTGSLFAANAASADTQGAPEAAAFGYSFKPDPQIYAPYAPHGITISNDGAMLLYNGQRVRLFVDESADQEAFFLDEAGTLDLAVIRSAAGQITGLEGLSEQSAQQYRSAFFAEDTTIPKVTVKETVQDTVQDVASQNKLEQYFAYGITLSENGEIMYINGQRVRLLFDQLADGTVETFWFDEAGTADLSVTRNAAGQIASLTPMTEEQAQKCLAASEENEQTMLQGLEEKIEAKIKTLYPEEN